MSAEKNTLKDTDIENLQINGWIDRTVDWIKSQVCGAGCSGTVVGLSGGIDSAVTATLCEQAFTDNSLAVILPCHSAPEDVEDAWMVADAMELEAVQFDLEKAYAALSEEMFVESGPQKLARANVKPRLRMTALYYLAQSRKSLVIGTDNLAELHLGYFTKFGDGGCDILPLARLTKGQVYEVAAHLGIPDSIIERKPSAGLWPGQTDEGELGLTYRQVDAYLQGQRVSDEAAQIIQKQHKASEHKRRMPPVPQFGLQS